MSVLRVILLGIGATIIGFMSPIMVAKLIGVFPESPAAQVNVEEAQRVSAMRYLMPIQGKGLYTLNCTPCHGISGEGNVAFNAPALAGQRVWYLTRQLNHFKNGTRGAHPEDVQGMQMAPIVRLLADDQAVQDVAEYISRMSSFDTPTTLKADASKGKALYVGTCLPCHGEKGRGNWTVKAPRLAGQADWYLVRQISKFRKGIRGADADDLQGLQMASIAKTLIDAKATNDLAVYINGLNREISATASQVAIQSTPLTLARGKALYALNCAPCHQSKGEGNAAFNAPALAGQRASYLTRQLNHFKNGTRGAHPEDVQGMQMAPILRLLTDAQAVHDVTQYISRMTPFSTAPTLNAEANKGKALFVGTCLPCHGERGEGNKIIKAPRLAGQADWYLVRQLTKFRKGIRGASAEDLQGTQMASIAKTFVVDEEVTNNLAAYINELGEIRQSEKLWTDIVVRD